MKVLRLTGVQCELNMKLCSCTSIICLLVLSKIPWSYFLSLCPLQQPFLAGSVVSFCMTFFFCLAFWSFCRRH